MKKNGILHIANLPQSSTYVGVELPHESCIRIRCRSKNKAQLAKHTHTHTQTHHTRVQQ